jgi:polyphenol oxidase
MGLIYGTSTVKDGNMSVKWGEEKVVLENRRKFLEKLGIEYVDCVMMSLVAGNKIVEVFKKDRGRTIECDGLVTKDCEVGLWMAVGDCFPVVVFDPVKRILAIVHAGKPGVGKKIVSKVIEVLCEMGSNPGELLVKIGPGIRKESYRWWEHGKVAEKDDCDWKPFLEMIDGVIHIDLPGYIKKQLLDSGVRGKNIDDCGIDTVADKNYFSHFRVYFTKETEGRFATVACLPAGRL